jgi:hypothetical protein
MMQAAFAFVGPGRMKRIVLITGLIVVFRFIAHIPLPSV